MCSSLYNSCSVLIALYSKTAVQSTELQYVVQCTKCNCSVLFQCTIKLEYSQVVVKCIVLYNIKRFPVCTSVCAVVFCTMCVKVYNIPFLVEVNINNVHFLCSTKFNTSLYSKYQSNVSSVQYQIQLYAVVQSCTVSV